jgi:tetratricopeptide (TPR) repeat protein
MESYRTQAWRRSLAKAALAICVVSVGRPAAGFVGDDLPDKSTPAAANEANDASGKLKPILERLNGRDRELVELRIAIGRIPDEHRDQRIISLLELPYLGSAHYGSPTNQRFFAVRLTIVNLTGEPVVLTREQVRLISDGQNYPAREASEQLQFRPIQIGRETVQLRSLPLPAQLAVPVGDSGSTWLLFPDLPPGNHIPPLVVKLKFGDTDRDIDVNALARGSLGLSVERLGPRSCLGLIRISGSLNTVNVGSLVDELDRFAGDRLVRAAIIWDDGSSISESALTNWLQNSALSAGRQQQFAEQQFPGLPASLREFHLARLPGNQSEAQSSSYPSNFVPVTAAVAAQRIHKTEAEAVIAALRSAYDVLPRDEVLQAIRSGCPVERAAALAGGAGRLAGDKLPVILKYADDSDPVIQQAALLALSHFGGPAAIEKLVSYARQDAASLSSSAMAGLAGSRYESAHQALLRLLDSESLEAKKRIIKIMAAHPRIIWRDAIYEFVKDSRSGLNVEALSALVQVEHPKLLEVLALALKGGDAALKMQAFNILAARADRESEQLAVKFTLEHLASQPATPVMLELLGRVKDERALPLLLALFNETPNKPELIQKLALIGDDQTGRFLIDRYPQLQNVEKGEILKLLVRSDPPGFRHLARGALQSGDGGLVGLAVQGLQEDSSAEAIKIMTDALEASANSFTWSYLCNALAAVATPAARSALLKARDSTSREKRNFAVNALQLIRQRSPGYPYFVQAQQFANSSKWKEAVEYYDTAIGLDPNLSDAYAGRGHSRLSQEKYAEAGKDFSIAYEQDPYNSLALTGMCLVMVLADGRPVEAVKKLEEDRAKFQNNAMFNYNAACVYGRAYEHLEKDREAENRAKRLQDYKQAAFTDLKKSIEMGFQEFELMKNDPDLAPFQELPEFQELIKAPPADLPAMGARPKDQDVKKAAMRLR